MKNMALAAVAAAALVIGPSPRVEGVEFSDRLKLDVYGRSQMIGVGEMVSDPVRNDARLYLFMKQARLGVKGLYDDVRFDMQFAFGGESANGANTDLSLLDFVVDIPIAAMGQGAGIKVGQFRVPYSREGLTDRGYMSYGERSIMNMASYQSRDYGVAIQKNSGALGATAGVFSSGGRDVPQRYLPEVLGVPALVARVGFNDGVDDDIYHVAGTELNPTRTAKSAHLNALYNKDTLIGHSTAINVRTIDKNLLVDSSFNQFISAGPNSANGTPATLRQGELWFAGGDAVIRHPLGSGRALEAEVEFNYGHFRNEYGRLQIAAGRVQGSFHFKPYQLGLRYAALKMDRAARYRTAGKLSDPMLGDVIHEITPSLTWHIKGHNMKLVADAPVYFDMPVFIENNVGAYVFAVQPSQVSYIATAGNYVERQTVANGRLMFQFAF